MRNTVSLLFWGGFLLWPSGQQSCLQNRNLILKQESWRKETSKHLSVSNVLERDIEPPSAPGVLFLQLILTSIRKERWVGFSSRDRYRIKFLEKLHYRYNIQGVAKDSNCCTLIQYGGNIHNASYTQQHYVEQVESEQQKCQCAANQ